MSAEATDIPENEDEINKALRLFYFNPETINNELYQISNSIFEKAINDNFSSSDFRSKLIRNASFFSAHKTVKQCEELTNLLYDGDRKRPFREFKKVSKTVVKNYNQNWLKVEVSAVTRSTRMAEVFRKAQGTKSLYPNLEYMPSRSATPRDEHRALWGIIRPVNDAFWSKYMPPSAWNCLCSIEPTDSEVTDIPDELPDVPPVFAVNTGKTAELFGKEHPYFDVTKDQEKSIIEFLK